MAANRRSACRAVDVTVTSLQSHYDRFGVKFQVGLLADLLLQLQSNSRGGSGLILDKVVINSPSVSIKTASSVTTYS